MALKPSKMADVNNPFTSLSKRGEIRYFQRETTMRTQTPRQEMHTNLSGLKTPRAYYECPKRCEYDEFLTCFVRAIMLTTNIVLHPDPVPVILLCRYEVNRIVGLHIC